MIESVVACIPVNEADRNGIPYTPSDGSEVIKCPRCQRECWIGPRQRAKAAAGFQVLCVLCVRETSPEGTFFHVKRLDRPHGG